MWYGKSRVRKKFSPSYVRGWGALEVYSKGRWFAIRVSSFFFFNVVLSTRYVIVTENRRESHPSSKGD